MSILTLIRAKEEDSGNYTVKVENGDQIRTVGLILEVKGQRQDLPILFAKFISSNIALSALGLATFCVLLKYVLTLYLPHHYALTVPAVIVDLMDIHHGSATGQSVVCITRGQPTPVVEWFICKNIKQ